MEYRWIKENELNSYELENKRLSYYNLFYKDDALILCNNIIDDYEFLELQNDFDDIDDLEIYQYYIISDDLANRLIKYTDEIVYYHNKLDIYVLGVCHYGTSWQYILTDFELVQVQDDKTWYKAIKKEKDDNDVNI